MQPIDKAKLKRIAAHIERFADVFAMEYDSRATDYGYLVSLNAEDRTQAVDIELRPSGNAIESAYRADVRLCAKGYEMIAHGGYGTQPKEFAMRAFLRAVELIARYG